MTKKTEETPKQSFEDKLSDALLKRVVGKETNPDKVKEKKEWFKSHVIISKA